MVTISTNLLFSIGCKNHGEGKSPTINWPDRLDAMSPNQRIHIIYANFTDLTYCLMYVCPWNVLLS